MSKNTKTANVGDTDIISTAADLKRLLAEHEQGWRARRDADAALLTHGNKRRALQSELDGRRPLTNDRKSEIEIELAGLHDKILAAAADRKEAEAKVAKLAAQIIDTRDSLSAMVAEVLAPEIHRTHEAFDRAAQELVTAERRMAELDRVMGRELYNFLSVIDPRTGNDLVLLLEPEPAAPKFAWLAEVRQTLQSAEGVYVPSAAAAA